ncbi:MAG TPA: TatD family hydrolase [Bacillales bacterium]|nr:TatD family hydrolase [Bacillales bacterium]
MDAHIHLDQYPEEEIERLVEQWKKAGVESVVAVSMDLASSYRTLELKHRFPDFIYAAVGHHPEQKPPNEADANELLALMSCERESISAIGEVGLPHYTLDQMEPKEVDNYRYLLASFVAVANILQLPLALHAVHEQTQPVLNLLLAEKVKRAHFHWLKADENTLQNVFDSGYSLSLTPEVCYRARDQKLAEKVPIDQLLVETDGPWPFSGPLEGIQTTPLFLNETCGQIAEIRKQTTEQIIDLTSKNAKKIYGDH